ncbi:MAG: hypothetical protein IH933_07750 [Euryarchaeota archaeon]|jgi:hypothetical protein|nr:hypothetical protein [Euryarchaeota archaeon]
MNLSRRAVIATGIMGALAGCLDGADTDIEPSELEPGRNEIPSGTTIDGDGETIHVDEVSPAFLRLAEGCTVRNLTLVGHRYDAIERDGYWDLPENQSPWEEASCGIWIEGDDVTIENVACHGWAHAGIAVGEQDGESLQGIEIRDSVFTENNAEELGYGAVVYNGYAEFDGCYWNNNRHDVAGSGIESCGYEVRNSELGPEGRLYGFEMHEPGGHHVNVESTTFAEKRDRNDTPGALIVNRGTPIEECFIERNWFQGELTTSLTEGARERYRFGENHVGPDPPSDSGIGSPRSERDA